MPGVGNVGDFQKTFFVGERAEVSEVQKHRTSLGKSTEVLPQKYGGFMQRSPMFLFFRKPSPSPPQKKVLVLRQFG